jgi:aspartokinase/homoserine dehydrogenase 1
MGQPQRFRVAKFGGTSVQDQSAIRRVADIVLADPKGLVVVLSAMGGVTDLLLGAADAAVRGGSWQEAEGTFRRRHLEAVAALLTAGPERDRLTTLVNGAADELGAICRSLSTLRESTVRTLDMTCARGERMLAQIFHALMRQHGIDAEYVDATELIKVDRQYGTPFPNLTATTAAVATRVIPVLAAGKLVVIPGFIGTGTDGELVTLGRGGSDLSATVMGHAVHAELVTLFKEVDGLLTADPKFVREARIVPELHYREAAELAYYGAKVLHSRTIIPLLTHNIPLNVRNTFQPEQPGTRIAGDVAPGAFPVKALTAIMNQSLIAIEGKGMMGVPGIAARTFAAMAHASISVSVISQASSEASICFVVPSAEAKTAVHALKEAFRYELEHKLVDDIRARDGLAVLAVVGLGMKGTPGIASRTFTALARGGANVEAIAQGSSELNISVVVEQGKVADALAALHREFRLEKLRALPAQGDGDVRLAVFGVGQIGRALIRQTLAQQAYYREKMHLDLRVTGLVDSSGLMLADDGFTSERLQDLLIVKDKGGHLHDRAVKGDSGAILKELREKLWQLPVKKAVFVDATAGDTAPLLLEALNAGWHVVVANKKPLAVAQAAYDELFETAARRGVFLRYEATVGAGLPILDTLAKLKEAGDEIREVLGCFSGTLGYLMTALSDGAPFSEAVRRAHSLGFTEPDPREDLTGMDVARKALILARTLGFRLELASLRVEPLFPASLSHDDPETFIDSLKQLDGPWAERIKAAKAANQEIRYVARIGERGVAVGLENVPQASPLGRLRGTDNQVSIHSRRYDRQPLVVSGPGAGAEVTAAGVLNDVLAIAAAEDRPRPAGRGGR